MARGRALPGTARGGEGIPASRPARARVATGLGAVAAWAAVAAYAVASAERYAFPAEAASGVALVLLAIGLVLRWPSAIAWAIAFLGVAYACAVVSSGATVDSWCVAVAGALIVLAELAYWSIEKAGTARDEPGAVPRRLAALAALLAGSALAGLVVVTLGALVLRGGLVILALGVAAAAALVGLLAALARRAAA